MLTNEVTVNIYLLAFILGISVFAGFAFRAKMILKCRAKIEELEREILNNYEHILELERETSNMESQMQDIKSPGNYNENSGQRSGSHFQKGSGYFPSQTITFQEKY